MKTTTYNISGMTCMGCVAKVQKTLEALPEIHHAEVKLEAPQASIHFERELSDEALNKALAQKGAYHISKVVEAQPAEETLAEPSVQTYKPLIMIVSFIAGVSLLAQYPFVDFSAMLWMRHFMAGFFIVFAFFKLLNLKGFASSYAMYDVVASRFKSWGFIYPFVELILGIAYLINFNPQLTNWVTIIVLGISSIGVIESNVNKRKIKCACLGDVFNLPMSTVTIVEDLGMVAMAVVMLLV